MSRPNTGDATPTPSDIRRGDIVFADVPFDGDYLSGSKDRPAVVLAVRGERLVVQAFYRKERRDRRPVPAVPGRGLRVDSYLDPTHVFIDRSRVRRIAGRFNPGEAA